MQPASASARVSASPARSSRLRSGWRPNTVMAIPATYTLLTGTPAGTALAGNHLEDGWVTVRHQPAQPVQGSGLVAGDDAPLVALDASNDVGRAFRGLRLQQLVGQQREAGFFLAGRTTASAGLFDVGFD